MRYVQPKPNAGWSYSIWPERRELVMHKPEPGSVGSVVRTDSSSVLVSYRDLHPIFLRPKPPIIGAG